MKFRVGYRGVMTNLKRWSNIKLNLKEKKLIERLAMEKEVLVSLRGEQLTEAIAALGFEEPALEVMNVLGSTTKTKRAKERVNAPGRDQQVMAKEKANRTKENQNPIAQRRRAVNSAGGKAQIMPAATLGTDLQLHPNVHP